MDTVIKTNQPSPKFTLSDLSGDSHRLEDYLGKILVINFWSAECPWAKRVDEILIPKLSHWGENVVLLSIASNANEKFELLEEEAGLRSVPLLLLDEDQKVANLYGAITTPHIYLIDKVGVLRYQGAFDDVKFRQPEPTVNYLFPAVEALQAGKNPDPAEMLSYGCTVVYFAAD